MNATFAFDTYEKCKMEKNKYLEVLDEAKMSEE